MHERPTSHETWPAVSPFQGEVRATPVQARYEVIVGHARVRVESGTIVDAIARARQQLCREMPWLWDVIQALDVRQFCVRLIDTGDRVD